MLTLLPETMSKTLEIDSKFTNLESNWDTNPTPPYNIKKAHVDHPTQQICYQSKQKMGTIDQLALDPYKS